jgi:hypothetical protein
MHLYEKMLTDFDRLELAGYICSGVLGLDGLDDCASTREFCECSPPICALAGAGRIAGTGNFSRWFSENYVQNRLPLGNHSVMWYWNELIRTYGWLQSQC